jgi:uncharacterized protein YbaP (TraB family)
MSRFKSLLASSAILLAVSGCATVPDAPIADASIERVETDGPALWKVADEDTTIYLFGTVHILPEGTDWSTPAIESALASSGSIVTELLPGAGETPEDQQLFMARGMLEQGQTLRGLMSDDQRAAYEEALGKLGLPPAAFDQFKPWTAGITLSIIPLVNAGYNPESGVEKVLEGMAGPNIERGALETIEYQLQVFDGLPQEKQITFLIETAEQVDNITAYVNQMVTEWMEGDKDALAELMNESLTDPVLAERLLYERNRNWADWIDQRLDQPGTVFIAVGAGHLAGEKSVQDYLEDRGVVAVR